MTTFTETGYDINGTPSAATFKLDTAHRDSYIATMAAQERRHGHTVTYGPRRLDAHTPDGRLAFTLCWTV